MSNKKKTTRQKGLQQGSYTKKELDRLVYEMQLLERPLSEWDKNAFKGHISRRAKAAAQARLNRRIEKYDRLNAQKCLVELGLLKLETVGGRIFISLTAKGKVEAMKNRIINTTKKFSADRLCLVSFDIPEHIRNIRWHIRQLLKRADFEMVHKSLWKSTKDVSDDFALLIKELDIQDWVHVYIAKKVDVQT